MEEAGVRGLINLKTTTEALPCFNSKKNVELFARHEVLTADEIESRLELLLEAYTKVIRIEALTMLEISHRDIVPAVIAFSTDVCGSAKAKREFLGKSRAPLEDVLLSKLFPLSTELSDMISSLERALELEPDGDTATTYEKAFYYGTVVTEAMRNLRKVCDTLETLTDRDYWPLPSYGEVLYSVK